MKRSIQRGNGITKMIIIALFAENVSEVLKELFRQLIIRYENHKQHNLKTAYADMFLIRCF